MKNEQYQVFFMLSLVSKYFFWYKVLIFKKYHGESFIETTVNFNSLGLNPSLLAAITKAGFKQASPIQELTIEPILAGKDIFAQAETGSGKTGAFVIPILEQILRDDKAGEIAAHESRYAILSPTRELALQTYKVFQQFGKELGIESCCIVGGESIDKQKLLISKGIHVLVATPGRFVDLIKQRVVSLDQCKGVVFDEADRLFDMGFKKDIEYILSKTAMDRQLIMLSATSNQDVLRTAYKFKSHPEELKLNEDSLLVDHIDHKLAMISREEKFPLLVSLLRQKKDVYAIVFCNTQVQTHTVAEWLIHMGFKAKPISGRLPQNKRTKLMEEFRAKEVTILVCTDVAARGLDIKNVNLVINYDLPQEAANYVHRIGRTGRAGEEGTAISFCAYADCEFLDPIYDMIKAKIEKIDLKDSDFATDICKKPYIDRTTLKVLGPRGREEKRPERERSTGPSVKNKRERQAVVRPKPKIVEPRIVDKTLETAKPSKIVGNFKRVDRRFFEIEDYSLKSAGRQAMSFFKIEDETLLDHQILESGRRKYFFFGPKKNKYKFFLKPIYKKLLLPFLINVIKLAGLNLFVKVSFRPTNLVITFSGEDENLLGQNRFELMDSFEHLIFTYLQTRVQLHRNLNIQVKCFKSHDKRERKNGNEHLIKLAESVKKKVLESKKACNLKPLSASDRRIIHQHFEDDLQIQTSSVGDGRFKEVKLSLKE